MENLPKALCGVYLLYWIVTYSVDKVIRSLNNWGQVYLAFNIFGLFCLSHAGQSGLITRIYVGG